MALQLARLLETHIRTGYCPNLTKQICSRLMNIPNNEPAPIITNILNRCMKDVPRYDDYIDWCRYYYEGVTTVGKPVCCNSGCANCE